MKILLEGRPGSGKTTVVARLLDLLRARGVTLAGFVTHEVRERGRRVGFELETVDGRRAMLAHVDFDGPPRVGRYGVDLAAFERLALPTLEAPRLGRVVVIDELGKMELASPPFREAVARIFDSDADVVATVHVFAHPFTDGLKRRADVERVRLMPSNRGELPDRLLRLIAGSGRRSSA
jgi:nucleoside-triphosphatase